MTEYTNYTVFHQHPTMTEFILRCFQLAQPRHLGALQGTSDRIYVQYTVHVPDHDGGRPIEVNACILITHMVYL